MADPMLDDALAEIEKLRTTLDVKWQPMDTAPTASGADVILLVQFSRTKHAVIGFREESSSTGWIYSERMDECEPLGWWPIPKIED